jgi:polysaccharide pyruvyl transferase WcaK-like protein
MKRVVILDTWINDTNLGNKLIVEAVERNLREIFPHDFFYHVPALEYLKVGRTLIKQADYVFLAGTNALRSDMNRFSEWRLRIADAFRIRNVILTGVGWWQYQSSSPNLYTKILLRGVLSQAYHHSVRDSYTANKLKTLGFKVLNTGCPTLWKINKEHCDAIPTGKAPNALLTFTEYNQSPREDKVLCDIVARNYDTIYFWPQMYGDYHYAHAINGENLTYLDPSIEALDDLLKREEIDYVGTRLHAGIRALEHKRRTIIIGVDNRAVELGRDFNLPILPRENTNNQLEERINGTWRTEVRIDEQAITHWKNQFLA